MLQLKRFANLVPLFAGFLAMVWGLFGLFGPSAPLANVSAHDDPSLRAGGFRLATLASTPAFNRAWVKVNPTAQQVSPTPTQQPSATPAINPWGLGLIAEPTDAPAIPDRLVIPAIELDAPVVIAPSRTLTLKQQVFEQWLAPEDFAVGWHTGSAFLNQPGNTVLNGHHNMFGKVFAGLVDLKAGDEIILYAGLREFHYVVAQSMILKERGASLTEREANAQWILPSSDERITLVTCWPADNNTHRLLIVASPVQ